ncbi:MAG: hypothetical protein ACXV3F_02110, partial [Frankiaceae bacterium]
DKYLFESDPRLLRRVVEDMHHHRRGGPRRHPCPPRRRRHRGHVICAIDRSVSPGEALTDVGLTTRTLLTRARLS